MFGISITIILHQLLYHGKFSLSSICHVLLFHFHDHEFKVSFITSIISFFQFIFKEKRHLQLDAESAVLIVNELSLIIFLPANVYWIIAFFRMSLSAEKISESSADCTNKPFRPAFFDSSGFLFAAFACSFFITAVQP